MASQIVRMDALRSLANGSIAATYNPIGGAFTHPMRLIKMINTTNAGIFVSFDGVNDNDYLPANSFFLYDCTTNREESITYFVFAVGTQVFVRYDTAPSSGSVFLSAMFGQGE